MTGPRCRPAGLPDLALPGQAGSAPAAQPSRRAVLAAGAGLAASLGASPPLRAAPKRQISVAAYPLVDEIVKAALPLLQQRHPDVGIQVVSRQYADHHTAMTTALSTSVYLPDLMTLEASYMGRFAQGGGLLDLAQPPLNGLQFKDRFVPFAINQAINRRGALVALPTDIGPGTLLYRADLLAKAGLAEADLTASWEGYVDAGLQLKARTGAFLVANAQIVKDIVARSGIRPGEGMYFDAESRPLVQQPRFVRAFELARKVRRAGLDAKVGTWSNDWAEGFRRGSLATELSGAWMVGQMANWVAPTTKGLWRVAQLPGDTYVSYGGSYYALPRQADPANRALAWELMQLLTLTRERQFAAFKQQDAFPALLETFEDPFFNEPLPFLGGQRARLLWRDAARRIGHAPVHKQNNFADEVINTEMDNVLDHNKDIGRALADAQRLLERRAHR